MRHQTYARVYRFGDAVAFSTDDSGQVLYLPPELAREFAALLEQYAEDVEAVGFADSELGTRFAGREPEGEES